MMLKRLLYVNNEEDLINKYVLPEINNMINEQKTKLHNYNIYDET